MRITITDPVEQFLIEVHNLCDSDGRIGGYRLGEDPPDELRIAKILVAKIAAMEREACDADRQDAERYRYMRNNAQFQYRNGPGLYWYLPRYSDGKVRDERQQLDDAIDASIRARSQA